MTNEADSSTVPENKGHLPDMTNGTDSLETACTDLQDSNVTTPNNEAHSSEPNTPGEDLPDNNLPPTTKQIHLKFQTFKRTIKEIYQTITYPTTTKWIYKHLGRLMNRT